MYELAFSKLKAYLLISYYFRHYFGRHLPKHLKKCLFCINNPKYMKQQLRLLLILVSANFFLFSSCNKDENPPAPKTKTQLLTQSTWKFKSATVGGLDFSTLQQCQKDNIITFTTAGTGTIDEGATKCNVTDPPTSPLTWNFASGETILQVSVPLFSGLGNNFTLISLTETELVVSIVYTPPLGPSLTVVITFQH
jgi:hypothetical protein